MSRAKRTGATSSHAARTQGFGGAKNRANVAGVLNSGKNNN